MTFSADIPANSDSPGVFPAQCRTNWERLETIITANHQFNDTAATNDGYHINMKMLPQSVPANDATVGQPFINSADATNQLWWKDGNGNIYQLTPTFPIRAAVMFDGRASDGACTINTSYNIASVTRGTGTGLYTVSFTTAIPTNTYITMAFAQPPSTSQTRVVMLRGGAAFSDAQTTGSVKIQVQNSGGNLVDPVSCSLFVLAG